MEEYHRAPKTYLLDLQLDFKKFQILDFIQKLIILILLIKYKHRSINFSVLFLLKKKNAEKMIFKDLPFWEGGKLICSVY